MSAKIQLYFSPEGPLALEQVRFSHPLTGGTRLSVRGKLGGAYGSSYTFQWTPAVQALVMLLLKTKLAFGSDLLSLLKGGAGSPAASLDYAIGKQPSWLLDMFGLDSHGLAVIRRLVRRTNPERKRGGDVVLSLNPSQLSAESIEFYIQNTQITSNIELQNMLNEIEGAWTNSRGQDTLDQKRRAPRSSERRRDGSTGKTELRILALPALSDSGQCSTLNSVESAVLGLLSTLGGVQVIVARMLLSNSELDSPGGLLGTRFGCQFVLASALSLEKGVVKSSFQLIESSSGVLKCSASTRFQIRDVLETSDTFRTNMDKMITTMVSQLGQSHQLPAPAHSIARFAA